MSSTDTLKLSHSAIIELYSLDLTEIGGTETLRFVNWEQTNFTNIFHGGIEYIGLPIKSEGYERSMELQFSTPSLTISNIFSNVSALLQQYNGLTWAKVTRRVVLAKNLDGQPGANPNDYEALDVHYIAAYQENSHEVNLTLKQLLDRPLYLPRRRIIQIL
jgi:lambda family phage minor tail protein L